MKYSAEFQAGYRAGCEGEISNPYPLDTHHHDEWKNGNNEGLLKWLHQG